MRRLTKSKERITRQVMRSFQNQHWLWSRCIDEWLPITNAASWLRIKNNLNGLMLWYGMVWYGIVTMLILHGFWDRPLQPIENTHVCDFLSIINNTFDRIWQRFQDTALRNMHGLHLTSPGHSRSKQMPPNERPLYSCPSFIINLGLSARVSRLLPSKTCLTSIWPLQVNLGQS